MLTAGVFVCLIGDPNGNIKVLTVDVLSMLIFLQNMRNRIYIHLEEVEYYTQGMIK